MKKIFIVIWMLFLAPVVLTVASPPALAQFSDTHHLLNAVKDNDIGAARGRIFAGANVNAKRDGFPAITMAARGRNYEMMELLLDSGARPNIKTDKNEETVMMIIAVSGDEMAMKILLEYGADVNIPDRQGRTALMKAASARKTRIVKLLIANGADIFLNDYTGRDALLYAEEARARSVIRVLKNAMAAESEESTESEDFDESWETPSG